MLDLSMFEDGSILASHEARQLFKKFKANLRRQGKREGKLEGEAHGSRSRWSLVTCGNVESNLEPRSLRSTLAFERESAMLGGHARQLSPSKVILTICLRVPATSKNVLQ